MTNKYAFSDIYTIRSGIYKDIYVINSFTLNSRHIVVGQVGSSSYSPRGEKAFLFLYKYITI